MEALLLQLSTGSESRVLQGCIGLIGVQIVSTYFLDWNILTLLLRTAQLVPKPKQRVDEFLYLFIIIFFKDVYILWSA